MSALALLKTTEAVPSRPWARSIFSSEEWIEFARSAASDGWLLLALWAESSAAHALFLEAGGAAVHSVTVAVNDGCYPALSPIFPGATWYERMIRDLWGHQSSNGMDHRRWLDHGHWPQSRPMSTRPRPYDAQEEPTIAALADNAALLSIGPLWGNRDEPSRLELILNGSVITAATCRLGFAHKGTLGLMRGKSPRAAARFAARISGDSTVAHAIAFAQASEAALVSEPPPRAAVLRIVMAELERIAGHLDNLSEIAGLVGTERVQTQCGALREVVARAAHAAFGHRLMMDCVIPGGLSADITPGGSTAILRALGEISNRLPWIRRMFDGSAISAHLTGIGRSDEALALELGVGGIVGRACGRNFDARSRLSPGYAELTPRVATRPDGDAAARQKLRIFEVEESVRLVGAALSALPDGAIAETLPLVSGEGIGCSESIRGDVWHWLRLDHGQIAAAFVRDPGWALWPMGERVLETATVSETPLIRLSFALPASGMDL
jgi:Ni,Fe-hydrogenase III large subunit